MMQTPGTDKPVVLSNTEDYHDRHRHRHRRWYKRWWRKINQKGRATKLILIVALIAAALLIGYIGSRSDTILPTRPRRMVMNEITTAWSQYLNDSTMSGTVSSA